MLWTLHFTELDPGRCGNSSERMLKLGPKPSNILKFSVNRGDFLYPTPADAWALRQPT